MSAVPPTELVIDTVLHLLTDPNLLNNSINAISMTIQ